MNQKNILIFLFLSAFVLYSSFALVSPIKYWDETIYANLGRNIILFGEYSYKHGFADFTPMYPLAGIRPPILPLFVSLLSLVSFSSFWLNFIIPFFSALGILIYFLFIKKIFNSEIAITSSLLLMILPSFFFWSSKLLNDSLFLVFIIISSYFFFKYFIYEDKNKDYLGSVLFGLFVGLSFLTRYNFFWILPVFFFTLWFKYKNFAFLYERRLWISVITFFVVISPWFIFNYFSYHSVLGFLQNSSIASIRWGAHSIFFYFGTLLRDYWFLFPFLFIGLIFYKRIEFNKNSKFFFLAWFFFIFLFASLTPAKEDRYLLIIAPAICLLSSFGFYYLKHNWPKFEKILFILVLSVMLFLVFQNFENKIISFNSEENTCFFSTMDYIKNANASAVVTEHFSPVYFYTFVPNIRVSNYSEVILYLSEYSGKKVIYYYKKGDWFNLQSETSKLKLSYFCGDHFVFEMLD